MLIKLANLILFNTGWFACILGAAWGIPWFGPAVVAMIALAHLAWRPFSGTRRAEALLLLAALAFGYLVDSLLVTVLTGIRVRDVNCGLKAFRSEEEIFRRDG